jgi:desulfoferrodoxin (superoxide reductase-like protein)
MRCFILLSTFVALTSAFTPNHVSLNRPSSSLAMADEGEVFSRRQVVDTAVKGSFLAAALAAGAPAALAADISAQVKQIEKDMIDTVNTNGAPEKHLPKVTVSGKGDVRTVEIMVPHVMDSEKPHWIGAIWLKEEESGEVAVAKVLPATEPSPPTLKCGAPKGAVLRPMLLCNLHGLWQGEPFTV